MSAPQSRCSQQRGNCLEVSQTGERHDRKRAAQMPGCGRRGKPKPGFPSPPTSPWKSLSRFPHCRSPGHDRHGKVEIQKQDSHFATAPSLSLSNQKTKGDQPQPKTLSFRLISGLEYAGKPTVQAGCVVLVIGLHCGFKWARTSQPASFGFETDAKTRKLCLRC